jgi:hypothetical protein
LLECGSFLIPQEENFGRGDGLQSVIQFWKIQANDIATGRFCSQKKLVDVINYARELGPYTSNLLNLGCIAPDSTAMALVAKAIRPHFS